MANLGGMQRVSLKLHEALATRGDRDNAFEYDACLLRTSWRWVHLRTPLFLTRAAAALIGAARREDIDVVLFSSMVTAMLTVPLQGLFQRHGVRTAAITHGLDVTTPFPPYQWVVPRVFDALDAVFPVSRATAQACRDRGAAPERVHVIPNGIDADRFRPPDSRAEGRRALTANRNGPSVPNDALLLCSVGRQVERKGTAWFIDQVMPQLPSDVHYWIAGDGPQDDAIRAAIARHNLDDRVHPLGRVPNDALARLYRGADLFVMPNIPVEDDLEGFGIVLLEAGQCGTPAIAARLDGIQDVITDGVNGHLVTPESPDAFADTILQYRNDPAALRRATERAAAHTTETFSWASVADLYASALQTLHTSGRPPAAPVSPPIERTASPPA
ncbi:MAG: glycosyltransferase family 4 protein [Bacteroidetes bacterium SW_9_63_38]|nr:MAG: glycosyltransferase family 4 protein [Bacteroidetes bacterium SW_9_63_38]